MNRWIVRLIERGNEYNISIVLTGFKSMNREEEREQLKYIKSTIDCCTEAHPFNRTRGRRRECSQCPSSRSTSFTPSTESSQSSLKRFLIQHSNLRWLVCQHMSIHWWVSLFDVALIPVLLTLILYRLLLTSAKLMRHWEAKKTSRSNSLAL